MSKKLQNNRPARCAGQWWLYGLCVAGCMEERTRLFTVDQSWQASRRRGLVWGCAWILAGPSTVERQAYVITHHKLCCPSLVCEWPGNWCCYAKLSARTMGRMIFIVLAHLEVCLLIISTMALLSQWNIILELVSFARNNWISRKIG